MVIVRALGMIDHRPFTAGTQALLEEPEFPRLRHVGQQLDTSRCDPWLELLITARLVALGRRIQHADVAEGLRRPLARVVIANESCHTVALEDLGDLCAGGA